MRNTFSQWYDGQAAQRGCLSAPISHSIRGIAKHPCCCQLGNLTLRSRAWVKHEHRALLTGLGTSWGCTGGFGYQELFLFNFLALDFHPWRCEMKLSSTGADSACCCAGGAQLPRRAELLFLGIYWLFTGYLLGEVCVALCLQQPRLLGWKHLVFTTVTRVQNRFLKVPRPGRAAGSFVLLSLADRNILRNTSCIFNVLRAALWWLQSCPKHWGWTGIKAKSPVYSHAIKGLHLSCSKYMLAAFWN